MKKQFGRIRKLGTGIILILLLMSMLTLAFNIQPIKTEGTLSSSMADVLTVHNIDTGLNYLTIQEAINAIETLDGHTIQVDVGTYYEHVVVNKSVSLIGDRENTIIDGNLTGTVVNITANNVNITSFTIQNSGNDTLDSGILVNEWSTGNNIRHNIITNNNKGMILHSSSDDCVSENLVTANNYYGIWLIFSSNNSISRNNITDNKAHGLLLSSSSGNTVSENLVTANNWTGIYLSSSLNNNTIIRNNITDNGDGINLYDSPNNNISQNKITANEWQGISLSQSSSNIISGNNLTANMYDGIDLRNSSNNNTIIGNSIKNHNRGIKIGSLSNNNRISGNNITSHGERGIVLDSSNYNSISGNNITENKNGIDLEESSSNTITGNNITANNGFGIILSESSNNFVSENLVTANNYHGIILHNSSSNTISRGNITENNQCGVMIRVSSFNNTLFENKITKNSGGIWIDRSFNNTLFENKITNNTQYGATLFMALDNKFYLNEFTRNTIQVQISTSGYANLWDDGYPSGGNYWDDYTGVDEKSGPNQDQPGSDGIGDTPYIIDADNQDNYPLMTPPGEPAVTLPVHNVDTGLDYATIQEAINAPETLHGHTIFVEEGTYYEHVVVDKSVSLIGENRDTTIIDGEIEGTVVLITAGNVTITGFTIQNPGRIIPMFDSCVKVRGSNFINISYNTMTVTSEYVRGLFGITAIESTNDNTIIGNTITNQVIGIILSGSNNTIVGNIVSKSIYRGIYVTYLFASTFTNNTVDNGDYGILIEYSSNNVLTDNEMSDNEFNFGVVGNNVSDFTQDIDTSNTVNGKAIHYLVNQENITIDPTSFPNIGFLALINSTNITVRELTLTNNIEGLLLVNTNNSSFYHNNFIDNDNQVYLFESYNNTWNDWYEGNYWNDYIDDDEYYGEYQNETGSDGIWDHPYVIDANNSDNYPLTFIWWNYADINNDGKVDILDLAAGGAAFGSTPGHERWYCRADITRDGTVNILDLAAIAMEFGKIY